MAPRKRAPALTKPTVAFVRLPHGEGLPLPAFQTTGAAGMDLLAAVPEDKPLVLDRCDRALVPTGLVMQLPAGFEAQIRPRSGLAFKNGVTVLNSPGTIDSDYRGEVQVLVINLGREAFEIARGMRIAQMVVSPVSQVLVVEAKTVSQTLRGAGGFGSTGLSALSKKPAKKNKRRAVSKKAPKVGP
jgi:dUTP pyrophosphatase